MYLLHFLSNSATFFTAIVPLFQNIPIFIPFTLPWFRFSPIFQLIFSSHSQAIILHPQVEPENDY